MSAQSCKHVLDGGYTCGSPRVKGHDFCYWHLRLRADRKLPGAGSSYVPPLIENSHSIMRSLNHLFLAQSRNLIDPQNARTIQSTLRLALQAIKYIDHLEGTLEDDEFFEVTTELPEDEAASLLSAPGNGAPAATESQAVPAPAHAVLEACDLQLLNQPNMTPEERHRLRESLIAKYGAPERLVVLSNGDVRPLETLF